MEEIIEKLEEKIEEIAAPEKPKKKGRPRKSDGAAPAKEKAKKVRAKKAGKESSGAALVTKVYVQSGSLEYDCSDIVERAREDYKKDHKTGVHSCTIYIKPEDGMAYYVINKAEGKIEL